MQQEAQAQAAFGGGGLNPDDPSADYPGYEDDEYGEEEGSHASFADFASHPYFDQIRDRITTDPSFYNQFMEQLQT